MLRGRFKGLASFVSFMLEEMQSLALLGLLVCQYYLIRGCLGINEAIPAHGGEIAGRIDRTADLLDEVAQLISDFGDSISPGAVAQPPTGPMDLLTAFLNNRMNPAQPHATPEQEWEVLPNENDTPPTKFQGSELDQHR